MCSYVGRAQPTMRDGRRVAKDSKLLLQFRSSQNSISQNSPSNRLKRAYFATTLSCRPPFNMNWVSCPYSFSVALPPLTLLQVQRAVQLPGQLRTVFVFKGCGCSRTGSCPVFWDRLETFPGATQNLSEYLTLLHIQEKQISQVSLSLPRFRGRTGWKTSLHVFLKGVWRVCCWLQLKTPTKNAKPFKSLVNLLRQMLELQIYSSTNLWFHVFVHSGDTGFPAAVDIRAKAITPT